MQGFVTTPFTAMHVQINSRDESTVLPNGNAEGKEALRTSFLDLALLAQVGSLRIYRSAPLPQDL